MFHRNFSLYFLSLLQAPFSTHIYLSVLYICLFPLLGDKQIFKFGGVMSIVNTHFISIFYLGFSIFMI